jgi:hypothetical protein
VLRRDSTNNDAYNELVIAYDSLGRSGDVRHIGRYADTS